MLHRRAWIQASTFYGFAFYARPGLFAEELFQAMRRPKAHTIPITYL
ncbi:MAG: hypothetical protein U0905_18140 [Pirellulales bacterium]